MRLTEEQRTVIASWLRDKVKHRRCLMCDSTRTMIHDELLVIQTEEPGIDPASVPEGLVQVVCQNCGHVELFDARLIGAGQFQLQDATHALLM